MWRIGFLWKLINKNIVWNEIIENLTWYKKYRNTKTEQVWSVAGHSYR